MTAKNVSIKRDYTFDIFSSVKNEYKKFTTTFQEDFNSVSAGSLPNSWTNNVTANQIQGPVVVQNSGDANDRIFALKGVLSAKADVEGEPSNASHWRWIKYDTGFSGPIKISFKVYAGSSGDPYSLEAPEAEDEFYFQYKYFPQHFDIMQLKLLQ